MSPAFSIGSSPTFIGDNRTHQVNTLNHNGPYLTLFSEQLNENEEERENYKCASLPLQLYHHLVYSNRAYSQSALFPADSFLNSNSRPALSRLYCVFQI
jgi:hypothetical protein